MTNYLGIDYGLAHIGLALAQSSLATPLNQLKNDLNLFSNLNKLISHHMITHIIVGLPSGPIEQDVRSFASQLNRLTNIPVILHDETLSSQEATQKLSEIGASRQKRRNNHSYAATLILEDYLQSVLH